MKVKLDDLLESLEFTNESHTSFLNKFTGEIHLIPDELKLYVEQEEFDENELPEWEKEILLLYKDITARPENYTELPDSFYIDMYSIMERFILSLRDVKIRNQIYYEIKGTGAFRRFREAIEKFGILDEWYRYKDQALRETAIVWCAENGLEYY